MISYDVAVIGSGSFGSWSAWHMSRAGASVLLLDAWGPGHSRSSSGGESRIIRMGYGADEIYTRMAMRSLALWRQILDHRAGQTLFHRTGVILMAREDEPYSLATRDTLLRTGVPCEIVPAAELTVRYPQMRFDVPGIFGIFEPESGALMARRAVAAVVAEAVRYGVNYATEAVSVLAGSGSQATVRTQSGETIRAGTFVFACGAWLPKIFPDVLGRRIFPTRQEVFFFAPPPGDRRFASHELPSWIDFTDPRGPYGVPDLESRGFKLALDRHGPAFDPDTGDRRPTVEGLAEARCFLAERFPELRDAPLTESRVCQYESTCSGDFLIDRHPDFDNLWLAGGGSGHGFKHGPAVGEYLAQCVLGGGAGEPRFSLASKSETQQRTVY
ncbi:MAG TPA: FAD-dependent oxidoreductase [Candidatus Acidoferrales bacterium]|jgi:sarcosine oxidase|nr:FAD-dependent oxidoreductase [Candidatus Acidoferrales bacterium]